MKNDVGIAQLVLIGIIIGYAITPLTKLQPFRFTYRIFSRLY